MKLPREADTKKAIMDYLKSRDIDVFRMNAGDRFGSTNGRKWRIVGHEPGTADILVIRQLPQWYNASFIQKQVILQDIIWIEVKSPTGKQSEAQKEFQAKMERRGHTYILARSLDDVTRIIK